MKKTILILIPALLISYLAFGQERSSNQNQIELHSFKEAKSASGLDNLAVKFIDNWPKDFNGDNDCAWVRVKFENMTDSDVRSTTFSFGNSSPLVKTQDRLAEEEHEIWLFVTPSNNTYMEAHILRYGMSNRLANIKLEPKHAYDVVLKNNKTLSINIITIPDGATVMLNGTKHKTPATFTGIALGKHNISISKDGSLILSDMIDVNENNVRFEYDLRPQKTITIKSDPSDANLFINNNDAGRTPKKVELRYGNYKIEAAIGFEIDSKTITVDDYSDDIITLHPVKRKTFYVFATYGGRKVNADLYIDGKLYGKSQESYQIKGPIGKRYKMEMVYIGRSKKRNITVTENMDIQQRFSIAAKNYYSSTAPWDIDYDPKLWGITASYVAKQYVSYEGKNIIYKENLWGEENKWMHGFQLGFHFIPCFNWGGGLYTGLFYEYYISTYDPNTYSDYYDRVEEHVLYMPIHLYFRFPLADKYAISIHGGIGMDCGLSMQQSLSWSNDYYNLPLEYGSEYMPKRFNISGEIAADLRLGPIQITGGYSWGLNDHQFYPEVVTKQNKLFISFSVVL